MWLQCAMPVITSCKLLNDSDGKFWRCKLCTWKCINDLIPCIWFYLNLHVRWIHFIFLARIRYKNRVDTQIDIQSNRRTGMPVSDACRLFLDCKTLLAYDIYVHQNKKLHFQKDWLYSYSSLLYFFESCINHARKR